MGIVQHHAIIVTGSSPKIDSVHQYAEDLGATVSPLSKEVTNGYISFAVFPDGSKEGWDTSEKGNEVRDKIIAKLRETYVDWIEVTYGEIQVGVVRSRRG